MLARLAGVADGRGSKIDGHASKAGMAFRRHRKRCLGGSA
jgi:hypothetical protein